MVWQSWYRCPHWSNLQIVWASYEHAVMTAIIPCMVTDGVAVMVQVSSLVKLVDTLSKLWTCCNDSYYTMHGYRRCGNQAAAGVCPPPLSILLSFTKLCKTLVLSSSVGYLTHSSVVRNWVSQKPFLQSHCPDCPDMRRVWVCVCACMCVCIHVVCIEFWQYVFVENV